MIRWISELSRRFARVDRKGRSAVTSTLATLGIAFGVMTLTVVMSVMNGFQMSFIDAILEVSSYHLRAVELPADEESDIVEEIIRNKYVSSCVPFYEAQALMTGTKGGAVAVNLRSADQSIYFQDQGFSRELKMLSGSFDFSEPDSIVLGSSLARNLGVHPGSQVNLLVLSGGSDVELFSADRVFTVTGIFTTGYGEINNSYAFTGMEAAKKYFGSSAKKIWGIKLKKHDDDLKALSSINHQLAAANLPLPEILSWRSFNRTFFGALRIEKNMLLLLVALIFVVVAINIYNGMRRLVFERRTEIAVLSALGARKNGIKAIFIMRAFIMGTLGAVTGLILGVIISLNTDLVFNAAAKLMYGIQYLVTAITNRENLQYVQVNSSYNLYASIPARVFPGEVTAIALFGILSPLIASLAASRNVLKMSISEVLHNE